MNSQASSQALHLRRCCLIGALILPWLSACSDNPTTTDSPAADTSIIHVRSAPVTNLAAQASLRFSGVVQPREHANLTFQVGGVVRERLVSLGDTVKPGQLLARLFNPSLDPAREISRNRVIEIETETEQVRRDVARTRNLFERGMLAEQELDRQVTRFSALQASLASARAELRQSSQIQQEMRLEAPFAGTVESTFIEVGEFAAAGQPILRLSAKTQMEVEIKVPAELLVGLNTGSRVPVWIDHGRVQHEGRVVEVGQSASQGTVLYPLVINLDGVAVRPGDAVEVGLSDHIGAQPGVPLAAVMRSAEGLSVFRIEGERVRRVPVMVTGLRGEWALIDSGALAVGDEVVYSGLTRLADHNQVRRLP